MADLQNTDPIADKVARARRASSARPDIKFPTGQLNIIGGLAYAYSGTITVDTTDVVALDFTTTSDTIDAKFMVQYMQNASDGDDSKMTIEFNGVDVAGSLIATKGYSAAEGVMGPENWIPLIIPPYTRCRVLFTMLSGGGSVVLGSTLTGTVHE